MTAMKITALETIQVPEFSNLVWMHLHTDAGIVGLGETFRNSDAVVTYLHETVAPYLIGKDPRYVERHADALTNRVGNHFFGYPSRSVEYRGNSAADLALWDIKAKALGVPLHELLGGACHDRLRVYNTCASDGYNKQARLDINSAQIADGDAPVPTNALDDLALQHANPGALAESLLADGITAMKVWPFDAYATESRGHHISPEGLETAVGKLRAIRDKVGSRIDIMLELHSLWHLPAALQIARAVDDLDLYWLEDPIDTANFDDLARYRDAVGSRVTASENLGSVRWCKEALQRGAVDVVSSDLVWLGGVSAGRRIAALAEAFDRPVAFHDCAGPVGFWTNLHLLFAAPNALVMESVRAYTRGFYQDILVDLPVIENGYALPDSKPGLGAALKPELLARPDTVIRRTA
jgi:galactonate dehydratase